MPVPSLASESPTTPSGGRKTRESLGLTSTPDRKRQTLPSFEVHMEQSKTLRDLWGTHSTPACTIPRRLAVPPADLVKADDEVVFDCSPSTLEGRWVGPMPISQFLEENGFNTSFQSSNRYAFHQKHLRRESGFNPFAGLAFKPNMLTSPDDIDTMLELHEQHIEEDAARKAHAIQCFMKAVKKERMLSNFDLVNTSVMNAGFVQHTVEYELPKTSLLVPYLGTGNVEEYFSDDEEFKEPGGFMPNSEDEVQALLMTDSPSLATTVPISCTYHVQTLPDISILCPKETPGDVACPPRLTQEYHAAQELMFVYTAIDPFEPSEFRGITNSLSIHGLHLDDLQYPMEDQHPDDFQRWMLQAQIRQAAAERDRLAVIINELLTVYSHGKRNTELASTPLRGLRTHTFLVVMFHEHARLVRVDWSGAVVSEAFNFCARLEEGAISPLEIFLRGFDAMSREERGWDGTVMLVHPSSKLGEKAMDMLAPWAWRRTSVDADGNPWFPGAEKGALSHPPLLLLEVPDATRDGELGDSQPFIVWYPINRRKAGNSHNLSAEATVDDLKWHLSSYAPLYAWDDLCVPSRNTLVYPAFDPVNGTVSILKDSWRLYETSRDLAESEVLRVMNLANVENVPTLVCGQDVAHLKVSEGEFDDQRFHITRTQDHVGQAWNAFIREQMIGGSPTSDPEFCVRIHHRLVEKDICSPSKDIKGPENSEEFMTKVFHAMIGHYEAYALCGILHRDISLDNIMVTALGDGILCDWDRAQQIITPDGVFEHQPAVGTRPFQSSRILQQPLEAQNELQDDLESFVYVALWQFFWHLATVDETQECSGDLLLTTESPSVTRAEVREWMTYFFDVGISGNSDLDTAVGPYWKGLFCLSDREWDTENNRILGLLSQCPPLAQWLGEVRRMLTEWYTFRAFMGILDHDPHVSLRRRKRAVRTQQRLRLATHSAMLEVLRDVLIGEYDQDQRGGYLEMPGLNLDELPVEEEGSLTDDAPPPYSVIDPHSRVKVTRAREDETPERSNKRVRGSY
ncbi:hypothetical protein BKA70DRAFT_1531416 [Coprinopsis sp. MPI-PUGE-AT-0042]|nr:hypothetical protein BKA70DRAFT_1531416 [Coprinopsis sp. MPI-PUGE-AT-0042]